MRKMSRGMGLRTGRASYDLRYEEAPERGKQPVQRLLGAILLLGKRGGVGFCLVH